jgi:hypothetical protein
VGVTTSHHGKSFDPINPLVDLRVYPICLFTAGSDKTAKVSVSSGAVKIEFIKGIEGRRGGVNWSNQD